MIEFFVLISYTVNARSLTYRAPDWMSPPGARRRKCGHRGYSPRLSQTSDQPPLLQEDWAQAQEVSAQNCQNNHYIPVLSYNEY